MSPNTPTRDQDRLNLALSAAHMGTWDWEVDSGLIWWDDRMHHLFGLKPGVFAGNLDDFLNFMHPDDRERVRSQLLDDGEEFDGEFRSLWKDGSLHYIRMRSHTFREADGRPSRIIGVAWDITERRRTEMALDQERNLLATLMEHLPDHIYFKDVDSRFIAVNQAMAQWAGIKDPRELIGKSDHDLFTSEHANTALEDERRILRTGNPIVNHEEKETWPDREDTWVSTTKMPLRDHAGKIIGTFGLSRDITTRRRKDERLRQLAEELRIKNQALQEDLEMARELQSALLPHTFPHFPADASEQESAVRFYHFFQPSMMVSGDFFDVLEISDNEAGLFICDVMGHGVRAALVAATIRTLIGELRGVWNEPGEFLARLNESLIRSLKNGHVTLFASAFYVVADLRKGELRYANAGHPSPFRVTHNGHDGGSRSAPLNSLTHGPAMGLFGNAEYRTQHCQLSPRDVLLLFTDGLFEVEGTGGRLYDYQQLSRAVGARIRLPTRELCHSLIADVRQFSANRQFNDDVCLVAMDINRLQSLTRSIVI